MWNLGAPSPSNQLRSRALRLRLSASRVSLSSHTLVVGQVPAGPKRIFGALIKPAIACPTGTKRRKFRVPMKRGAWKGNRRGEGTDLGNLGNAYADLGETRKAIEYHGQALIIVREIGDRGHEGATLGNLGLAYAAMGE